MNLKYLVIKQYSAFKCTNKSCGVVKRKKQCSIDLAAIFKIHL